MKPFANISPEQFSYSLPEDRIAMFPTTTRDQSRLLIREKNGSLYHDLFSRLADYLPAQSHLFFNNSRVIPARLVFSKSTGSKIEIFCLKPLEPNAYDQSLASADTCIWECMIGNLKRFTANTLQMDISIAGGNLLLKAEKLQAHGNTAIIKFSWDNISFRFGEILSLAGKTPLPPYIKRVSVPLDKERYQTIYSRIDGSVAAPTAGLHFTGNIFSSMKEKQISCHEVTLHVGAGTFQPIKSRNIAGHEMHAEYFIVTPALVQLLADMPGRVSCVGTTTVRTLESIYWLGVKLINAENSMPSTLNLDQWEAYILPRQYSEKQSFEALLRWFATQKIEKTLASTKLMIVPGYKFRIADTLITNFHQPGSTLLLLIAAFIGESWRETYDYALQNGFRFLSYGDSSLLFNPDDQ